LNEKNLTFVSHESFIQNALALALKHKYNRMKKSHLQNALALALKHRKQNNHKISRLSKLDRHFKFALNVFQSTLLSDLLNSKKVQLKRACFCKGTHKTIERKISPFAKLYSKCVRVSVESQNTEEPKNQSPF